MPGDVPASARAGSDLGALVDGVGLSATIFSVDRERGRAPAVAELGHIPEGSTMRKTLFASALLVSAVYATEAATESVRVSLSDYAFDFPKYGYEIIVSGGTQNFGDKLTADDYITIDDDGYRLKTLIDRMNRKDRQDFISFFNSNCIGFTRESCAIIASGDVELDENMRMIFRISTAKISKDGNEWTNANQQ